MLADRDVFEEIVSPKDDLVVTRQCAVFVFGKRETPTCDKSAVFLSPASFFPRVLHGEAESSADNTCQSCFHF